MNFISICSGIEAASVAFGPLGWKAIAFSEIEPFPCAVLAHHYPDVPNLGDMTKFREWPEEIFADADAVVGGPPCQAFSVAGARNGLNDDRGNLTLTYAELINHADAIRFIHGKPPVVVLYENVPGLLSDKTGAFGCFLAGLAGEDDPLEPPGGKWANAGCVFGPKRAVAWRVLDAQYFGVAQRRRRVFVVASARKGFDPATVLFEWDGVRRDTAPSREAGKGSAGVFARSVALRGREGGGTAELGDDVQNCLRASTGGGDKPHIITMAHDQGGAEIGFDRGPTLPCNHEAPIAAYGIRTANTSSNGWGIQEEVTHTLDQAQGQCIAFPANLSATQCASTENLAPAMGAKNPTAVAFGGDIARTLQARHDSSPCADRGMDVVATSMQVRRLTPVECERLQGFPTVSEKVIIEACLDQQNQSVRAALRCLRWQNSAWPADASESMLHAHTAAPLSSTHQAAPAPLAALHVQLHYGHEVQAIRSRGRLIWSVSGAAASEKSPPPTPDGNTAAELARLLHAVAKEITAGKAGSPDNIRLSFQASSGATSATKSGHETAASAGGVESAPSLDTFTTFDLGRITTCSDSTAATLCCSVLRAIAGCIPRETLPATFSIELTVESPYTAIPWRGKPASECPDGPRYKALGNSWAVPNVRWIGQRIDAAVRRLR